MANSITRLQLRRMANSYSSQSSPNVLPSKSGCVTSPRYAVNEPAEVFLRVSQRNCMKPRRLFEDSTGAASSSVICRSRCQESPNATSSKTLNGILQERVQLSDLSTEAAEPSLFKQTKHLRSSCVPSVDTPNRYKFFKDGLDAQKMWNKLGQGAFGTVVQAQYKGGSVAVKLISIKRSKKSLMSMYNESNALKLSHPNIIKVLQVLMCEGQHGMVLMERSSGTDLQTLSEDVSFEMTFNMRLKCAIEIAAAIQHCHQKQVLHLDIKPQNILYSLDTQKCQLCDFGSSCVLDGKSKVTNLPSQGTAIYTDPDILQSRRASTKSDVYSFGITLWQLLAREIPYSTHKMHLHTIIYKVVTEELRPREIFITEQYDQDYTELYQLCWSQKPEERPNVESVIQELKRIAECNN